MKISKRQPMWDRLQSKHRIRKISKIEKTLTSLLSWTHYGTAFISNKNPWPFQSSLQLWPTVLNIFFPYNMSVVAHLYGCAMAELWIAKYSAFMKDFASFKMKNIHPSDVFSIETYLFLFIQTRNLRIFCH